MAPRIEIIVVISGMNSTEKIPIPKNIINGSSMTECPTATLIPEYLIFFKPNEMLAANKGPGAITPDAEIRITSNAKLRNSSILKYYFRNLIFYLYIESLRFFEPSSASLITTSAFSASCCRDGMSQDVPGIS